VADQDRIPLPAAEAPSRQDLEEMVGSATLAPSPDNNQPWLFEPLPDGRLLLSHDESRALPSDVDLMFSMIALGAALENLCLAAQQKGWQPRVEGPPERLTIRFLPVGTPDPLFAFLAQRATCRKPFARQAVAPEALHELEAALHDHPETALRWVSDRDGIWRVAKLTAATDRIRFEYPSFHEELHRQLRLTPAEVETTRDGLDFRTLELPPPAAWVLRWLRPWKRMSFLNRLGLSRLFAVQSALLIRSTGTIGLLSTRRHTRDGYLDAGRALQRVWLTATKLGLAFHPLGSVPIFLSRLTRLEGEGLRPEHRRALERVQHELCRVFPACAGEALVLLFRLGRADPPTARSLRRAVSAVFPAREGSSGTAGGNRELLPPQAHL
jgi:hypothetical protein